MIAHHCGTENAEHAKFCKGCGEQLSALAMENVTATGTLTCSRCSQRHLPGARLCGNCGADPVADMEALSSIAPALASQEPVPGLEKTVQPSAVNADGAMPAATADSRLGRMFLLGAIVIAAVAGGGWWLISDKSGAPEAGGAAIVGTAAPVSPAAHQPSASVVSVRDAAAGASREPASVSNAVADRKGIDNQKADQVRRQEEQRSKREAAARRQSEAEEQRRTAQDQRARQDSQTRTEAVRRSSQQGVQQQAELRTVKQICGDRPNAFSRSVCELRECTRPTKADSADCVELRERNAPSTHGVMN